MDYKQAWIKLQKRKKKKKSKKENLEATHIREQASVIIYTKTLQSFKWSKRSAESYLD